ncbi:MAG: hypothetical protein ACLSHU_06085 [Oscillospiraceae bacterium]
MEMWKTAVRFPHIPTALLRCLRRFFRIERKIARALILDPCLILADEPTGNLDRKNRQLIFNLLRQEHRKGRGIILITHDMETAIQADTIFQLERWPPGANQGGFPHNWIHLKRVEKIQKYAARRRSTF